MALVLLNTSARCYGQFDLLDSVTTLGGEVATLTGVSISGNDLHVADVNDGYNSTAGASAFTRPAATTTLTGSEAGFVFLTDDGIKGYGTMFGSVIGAVGGTSSSALQIGPASSTGSGKLTLWNTPGLFGVTLDALHTNFNPNASALAVGTPIYYTAAGKLCLSADKVSGAPAVGNFVEFSTGDTLVNTPVSYTRTGTTGKGLGLKYAVINWFPRNA